MKDNTQALRTQRIGRLVLVFSIPSVVGMVVNGLNNVVDRIFVGRGVGPDALAAVATVFPLVMLVQSISMLIGHGAASLISLRLGEGRRDDAESIVGNGFSLSVALGIVTAVVTALFMRPILTFFGGMPATLDFAERFTQVLLPGLALQMVAFVLNNMIRAQGDPITALLTMLIAAGTNCVLNALFIFGLGMGIAGSALATDLSQGVVVVWLLATYVRTTTGLRLRAAQLTLRWPEVARITAVGFAPCFVQLANVSTFILANNLVGRHGGETGVAVLGIASSLVTLMVMPIIGVRQGVQPIVGFNYGARAFTRVREALRVSMIGTFLICTAAYVLFFVMSRQVLSLFVKDAPSVVHLGVTALRIFLASIPLASVALLGSVYFQAVNKGAQAVGINMIRQLLVLVPLYLVLPRYLGLTGIWIAAPIAEGVAALLTLSLLLPEMRRLRRASESPGSPGRARSGGEESVDQVEAAARPAAASPRKCSTVHAAISPPVGR